ncbi:hypothetical protein [Azotobacter beijerinckii]|uniref:hypothetical protein n=1 Tax=Azotobacter beijerinckii TaxID=170623 RepID=UPI00111357E3|nr:hypothetical protein [Azotobacter beijerinckii]
MSAVKRLLASRTAGYLSLEDLILGIAESNDCTAAEAAQALATILENNSIPIYKKTAFSVENTYQLAGNALAEAGHYNNFKSPITQKLTSMFADDIPF